MAGIRNYPSNPTPGSKYVVHREDAGKEHMFAKRLDYNKLMFLHGPKARDYADLNHISENMALSAMTDSISPMRAPFQEMLEGMNAVEVIDKNFAQWRIYGKPETRAQVYGDPNAPDSLYGYNRTVLQVWVDYEMYKKGDIIAPIQDKTSALVVQQDIGTPFDGGYLYDAVIQTDSKTASFNPIYFTPGQYWIKLGVASSWEVFGQTGSIQMMDSYAYIEYRVPLNTMAWEFEITAEAHRQFGSIMVARCGDDGRPMPGGAGITNYVEARFKAQIKAEKELAQVYGRMTESMIDSVSGNQITTAPGIMEWLEYGQQISYSPETNNLDFFAEMFKSLWFDRLQPSEWNVTLLTGMAGMQLFSNWVSDKFKGEAVIQQYDFILKKATPFDKRPGRDGYAYVPPQFTQYVLPGYGSVRVAHWPVLDDTRINPVTYPNSMYPVSSYEFIALDSGFGKPNIRQVVREDNKYQTYQVGLWSPLGATDPSNPVWKSPDSATLDGYKMLQRESFGTIVTNPELIVHFRPNID